MIFHDLSPLDTSAQFSSDSLQLWLTHVFLCISPEDLDLEEGNWDIHVITGALKLFFRELQEPLFPYNLFSDFITGISKILIE